MRTLALSLTLLLFACGGTAPERTAYLLRAEQSERTASLAGSPRVGLSRVIVAPYLDQAGVVVEGAAREVQVARNHTWAEPLATGVRLLLRAELAQALGEDVGLDRHDQAHWQHDVKVFVEQLHGTMSGRAILVADVRIETRGEPGGVAEHRFVHSQPLAREGYAALVDAEAALVRELAQAIASAIANP
ncbi:MAG: membrane integrity-associated transporter subunit PqiC [Deltaproteobacteria bacterium]|nr:membrane integrity-associated transporter subunit PqiC [Deltaproteobacteria bacterium]MBW2447237.1 membrane integrity-associated transporter subunit PqiC [Deltaproteobacteria bacterium]